MSLISIVVTLVIVGVILYLVNTIVPLPQWIRTLINALAGLFVFVWLLQVFGLIDHNFLGVRLR